MNGQCKAFPVSDKWPKFFFLKLLPCRQALEAQIIGWRQFEARNYGWVVKADDESTPSSAKAFGSANEPTKYPMLVFTYKKPFPGIDVTSNRLGNHLIILYSVGWYYNRNGRTGIFNRSLENDCFIVRRDVFPLFWP